MASKEHNIDEHVGDLLSGYMDGEMTQQERQRVEIHCAHCSECESELQELRQLRERIGKTRLSEYGQDIWREKMDDAVVRTTRSIGWLMLVGFALGCAGLGVFAFLFSASISLGEKLIVSGIYLGLALLFFSVLRQRLIERKTDKYKDVEI
jgi:anti-sigma factor RsiW